MDSSVALLYRYQNGNTDVQLFSNGTKQRQYIQTPLPVWPENIDVKITDYCDAGCSWCHERSTVRGQHADLKSTLDLLTQLPAGVEIAIGGGNPLSHPDLNNFLIDLKSHGIVANLTVNEFHFEKYKDQLIHYTNQDLIKGVGYSYNHKPLNWAYPHAVYHVVIGVTPVKELDKIIQKPDTKILLLGYKSFGRGIAYQKRYNEQVQNSIAEWYRHLPYILPRAHFSFDNLAIQQLNPQRVFLNKQDFDCLYMGDEGMFSMYMDAVTQTYAVCSFAPTRLPYSQDISQMFANIKEIK